MKTKIYKVLCLLANYFGKSIVSLTEQEIKNQYLKWLFNHKLELQDSRIEIVVFSKDRAMQLHALLQSFDKYGKNYGPIHVLYTTGNLEHENTYQDLISELQGFNIFFYRETDFKSNLEEIINIIKSDKLAFFVDDMLFLRDVDFQSLSSFNPLINIISLTRGSDFDFSVVLGKSLTLPNFTEINTELLSFDWSEINEYSDWTYPLGLSGYIYCKQEMQTMLSLIDFHSPNTLEASLQVFIQFFIYRKGICYRTTPTCCIHANIVQTDFINPTIGSFGVEELREIWEKGFAIDVQNFAGKNCKEAELLNYKFINR